MSNDGRSPYPDWRDAMRGFTDEQILALEAKALPQFREAIRAAIDGAKLAWGWGGDYDGGCLYDEFMKAMTERGLMLMPPETLHQMLSGRGPALRRQVMERDKYRCQHCDTHLYLTIDHIQPSSKGGRTTLENLQVLCNPCNARKGAR